MLHCGILPLYMASSAVSNYFFFCAAVTTHPKEEMVAMPNGMHTLGCQWLEHTEAKEQHIKGYVLPQAPSEVTNEAKVGERCFISAEPWELNESLLAQLLSQ